MTKQYETHSSSICLHHSALEFSKFFTHPRVSKRWDVTHPGHVITHLKKTHIEICCMYTGYFAIRVIFLLF